MEGAAMNANTERIRDALQFIPVGAHDERVRMAFMLKSEMGEAGRDLWDEWRGDRGSDEAASVWKSASETGPLKIGTLFHEAKANGWRDDGRHPKPTPEELAEQQRINAERAAQAEAEQRTKHEAAMLRAAEILASATGDPATHPYAAKIKRGVPFGPRVKRGAWPQRGWPDALLIPIFQADGKISSIEARNVDGAMDSLKDGKKAGGFHHFGKITGAKRVLIGEGPCNCRGGRGCGRFAGSGSIDAKQSQGHWLDGARKAAPDAEIIFLADHDPKPDGTNPGLRAAEDAARACGGKVATPGTDATPCDFWDVWARGGKDAVKQALATARIVGAGDTAKESPASSNSGVTEVTGVQASNGAASGCTPDENDGVTGVTKPPADTERPCFRVFDEAWKADGKPYPSGVWYFGSKPGKGDEASNTVSAMDLLAPACRGRDVSTARTTISGGNCASRPRPSAGAHGPCRWKCSRAMVRCCALNCSQWAWKSTRRRRRETCSHPTCKRNPRSAESAAPCKPDGTAIHSCCRMR
jgi:phage/plasmid primase-like uncharacterized protein